MDNATREEIARAMAGAEYGDGSTEPFEPFNHFVREIEPILDRLIAEARDKALEEAAGAARGYHNGVFAALAISALKTKDNPHA